MGATPATRKVLQEDQQKCCQNSGEGKLRICQGCRASEGERDWLIKRSCLAVEMGRDAHGAQSRDLGFQKDLVEASWSL